jgi:hypothetical protein
MEIFNMETVSSSETVVDQSIYQTTKLHGDTSEKIVGLILIPPHGSKVPQTNNDIITTAIAVPSKPIQLPCRVRPSGFKSRVVWREADVSEEYITSTFNVEERTKQPNNKQKQAANLICLVHYLTLKMETIRSSKTSGFILTTRSYNPEDRFLDTR